MLESIKGLNVVEKRECPFFNLKYLKSTRDPRLFNAPWRCEPGENGVL